MTSSIKPNNNDVSIGKATSTCAVKMVAECA